MSRNSILAAFALLAMSLSVAFAGPRAEADLAAIADHFTKTSAAFDQSRSNWRWVFYGDSITHGCAHTQGWRNFVEIFEERIRWEKASLFDTVINSGNSGYSSTHLVNPGQYEWQVSSLKPNVVLILIGINDIVLPDASLERFRQNLVTLVTWVRRDGAIPVLQTYSTVKLLKNASSASELGYVKRYNEQDAYNQTIRDVAAQEDVILVDHAAYWKEHASDPAVLNFWLAEHLHPGARGHQEMARNIIRTLRLDNGPSTCLAIEAGGKQPEPVGDEKPAADGEITWLIDDRAADIQKNHDWSCTPEGITLEGDVLKLDLTAFKPVIKLANAGKMASLKSEAVFEMEMRMVPGTQDSARVNYLYLGLSAGTGAGHTEPVLLINHNQILGTLGTHDLPVELGKAFTLRMQMELATQEVVLYVDGQAIAKTKVTPVTSQQNYITLGYGSGSNSGVVEIHRIRLGGK